MRSPADGVVTRAGSSGAAGIWKIKNNSTSDVSEWSHINGRLLKISDRGDDNLVDPQRLLASGDYTDMEPIWSHSEGTRVELDIGHSLTYGIEHMDWGSVGQLKAQKDALAKKGEALTISQGDFLGNTSNNGWSTGAHAHIYVTFQYPGWGSQRLNPVCVNRTTYH